VQAETILKETTTRILSLLSQVADQITKAYKGLPITPTMTLFPKFRIQEQGFISEVFK
tara:strand:+ start:605 stop:778 length:174 start_codon:yes stop_codon:yes gene_type:complete